MLYDDLACGEKAQARQRYKLLTPGAVRKQLAAAGFPALLDDTRYDLFSRIAHGNTTDAPQAHNAIGLPLAGYHVQDAGVLLVLNEMATVTALAVQPLCKCSTCRENGAK